MRHALMAAAALFLASGAQAQQATRLRVVLPGYGTRVALDSVAVARTVQGQRAQVFTAARSAFADFRILVAYSDSLGGVIANPRLETRRTLAGKRLSTFINCGSGMTGSNADSFRVTLAIGAFVDSVSADESRLRLAVAAGAEEIDGASKLPVVCGTTGALEKMIADRVVARMGTAP